MGWNLATDKAFREKAEYGHLEKGKKGKKGKKRREKGKRKSERQKGELYFSLNCIQNTRKYKREERGA